MDAMKNDVAGLSVKGDKRIRQCAVLMIIIVGTASALLSWNGLTYLGIQAGFPSFMAWLLPVSIDGMLMLGSSLILHSTLSGQKTWFGWVMTAVGVILSIFGNIASVGAHDVQSQVVHSIPPLMLFLSVEGMIRIVKHRIHVAQELTSLAEKEAAREAAREAKRQEAERLAQARKQKDSTVLLSVSKRGGSKTSDADPEVSLYKEILAALPSDASKINKVEKILKAYPEARTSHIGIALGESGRQMGTTVMRAKQKLLKEAGVSASTIVDKKPSDAFQEIVKGF